MINLKQEYNRDEVTLFLKESFLPNFVKDIREVDTSNLKNIKKAISLGFDSKLDLQVFEFTHTGSLEKRVTLTKEAFSILRDSSIFKALAFFKSTEKEEWRFSLMTATPTPTEKGKVKMILSNPKRLSFLLGQSAKVKTPEKFLIDKGKVTDFEDLKNRFSIEVVNKEFYNEISKLFLELVGGSVGKGKKRLEYKSSLKLPNIKDQSQKAQEFVVRLIGRIIFCWFLREKKDGSTKPLIPKELLSYEASCEYKDYYHKVLEPIFFEVLNKPVNSRKIEFSEGLYSGIPYLNGGLFYPHEDDFYSSIGNKDANN